MCRRTTPACSKNAYLKYICIMTSAEQGFQNELEGKGAIVGGGGGGGGCPTVGQGARSMWLLLLGDTCLVQCTLIFV